MPRYFYNVFGKTSILDDEGFDFRDVRQARTEALRYAAGVVLTEASKDTCPDQWRLEVTDADGVVVVRIDLSITPLAAKDEGSVIPVRAVASST